MRTLLQHIWRWPRLAIRAAWRAAIAFAELLAELCVRLAMRRQGQLPHFTVACVYRRANSPMVARMIDGLTDVRLWALDEPAPELAGLTLGSGPGDRMELLNRLLNGTNSPYVVIMDDDIEFVTGSIARLLAIAVRHNLDLCQRAHSRYGYCSHEITVKRVLCGLRMTNFVEIGPLVVMGPRLQHELIPFPPDAGQGWGLDVRWSGLCETHAARLAIIDAAVVKHLHPVGSEYALESERARLAEALRERGYTSIESLWDTRTCLRPWAL